MNDILDSYQRAQDGFVGVLESVPGNAWDRGSACTEWTVKDVAGHVIWGQHLVRHWATGQEYTEGRGAPGAPHPAELAGDDPVATFHAAAKESIAVLTEENLARPVQTRAFGEVPLAGFLQALVTDFLAHTWDIGYPLGMDVRLDPELLSASFAWSRDKEFRAPGGIGPELTPPAGADEQTRYLAFLGRRAF